jgi:hypothetical protein
MTTGHAAVPVEGPPGKVIPFPAYNSTLTRHPDAAPDMGAPVSSSEVPMWNEEELGARSQGLAAVMNERRRRLEGELRLVRNLVAGSRERDALILMPEVRFAPNVETAAVEAEEDIVHDARRSLRLTIASGATSLLIGAAYLALRHHLGDVVPWSMEFVALEAVLVVFLLVAGAASSSAMYLWMNHGWHILRHGSIPADEFIIRTGLRDDESRPWAIYGDRLENMVDGQARTVTFNPSDDIRSSDGVVSIVSRKGEVRARLEGFIIDANGRRTGLDLLEEMRKRVGSV